VGHWLPDGSRQGVEWISLNPTRNDAHRGSFSVNLTTGAWGDFATNDKGGDLVALVAYLEGVSQSEAAKLLGEFLGLAPQESRIPDSRPKRGTRSRANKRTKQVEPRAITPIPREAEATRPKAHPQLGEPSHVWAYRDQAGCAIAYVYRFPANSRNGESHKTFRPCAYWAERPDGKGGTLPEGWDWRNLPEPRPLYRLDALAARADAPILIVEGEKSADAAVDLLPDMVATTTMNGAQGTRKTDFGPLRGRRVFVWQDADEPGAEYARAVAGLSYRAGATTVAVLDLAALAQKPQTGEPRELPKGWDAADAVADGWSPEALSTALRWEPVPPLKSDEPAPHAGAPTEPPNSSAPGYKSEENSDEPPEIPSGFVLSNKGLWFEAPPKKPDDETRLVRISDPLRVLALTRDERGEGWGRLLEFEDRDGATHRWAAPCILLSGSGEALRTELQRLGLRVTTSPEGRRRLLDYVQDCVPQARARSVTRTGWTNGGVYVLPDRTLGEVAEPVIFQSETTEAPAFGTRATLDDWKARIGALCVGNSRLLFACSCAIAAPLLYLAGDESSGFHLKGLSTNASSSGKTTSQRVAASIIGRPEYVQKWRATDNALEAVAEQHNDALLILDELAQIEPRAAGEAAYLLANGAGKARAARTGDARPVKRWRLLFLSSGEIGLEEHMAAAGKRYRSGQAVRMIEIPADAGAGLGVFEQLHGYQDGAAFATALTDAAAECNGTPFVAFVEFVIAERTALPGKIGDFRSAFVTSALKGLDNPVGQVRRVAARFGLVAVAGELATLAGVTGWPSGAANDAALSLFRAWLDDRGGAGSGEEAELLAQVRLFFALHGESRFTRWDRPPEPTAGDRNPRTANRAGYVRQVEDDGIPTLRWYVYQEVFEREIAAGFGAKEAAALLLREGLLMPGSEGGRTRPTRKERLPGHAKTTRVYVFIEPGTNDRGEESDDGS
jgi:uncharacterized protein (DUF927 family)